MLSAEQKQEAIRLAWTTGNLNYKLGSRPILKQIRNKWNESRQNSRKFITISSRRTGKSSLGLLILFEYAIRNENATLAFVAPVKTGLEKYITDIYRDLTKDCPTDLLPEYLEMKNIIRFKNGSRILFVGSNKETFNTLRGLKLQIAFVDEARDIDDLEDLIQSVLMPALFDSNGYLFIASTPATSHDHYLKEIADDAEVKGYLFTSDIYACGYPPERIAEFMKEAGGAESATWKREYLGLWVIDTETSLFPEWNETYVQEIPKDELFQFFHIYEALDI